MKIMYALEVGLLIAAYAWKRREENLHVWNNKHDLDESWRTEGKYNTLWREGAIEIRIDCCFISGVGWEVGCHVENHELVRLREEGGKVRGLLEGGREGPSCQLASSNQRAAGTSSAQGALWQFWALGHFWALLGKKKEDGLPFNSRPCGLSPCCSGEICDRMFN